MRRTRLVQWLAMATAAVILLLNGDLDAQVALVDTRTWNQLTTDTDNDNFGRNANWDGGNEPNSSTTQGLFNQSGLDNPLINVNRTVGQLWFTSAANGISFAEHTNDRRLTFDASNGVGLVHEGNVTHTFDADIALGSNQTWYLNGTSGDLEVNDDFDLNSHTLTVNTVNSGNHVLLSSTKGAIVGTGGFIKTGVGTMSITGANTYSGTTTVSGGTLTISNASALGTGSTTTVQSGGTLALTGGITFDSETNLSLAGSSALHNVSGNNRWDGNISLSADATVTSLANELRLGDEVGFADTLTLGANTLTLDADGGEIWVNSIISGTGGVTKTGADTLTYYMDGNTYTGATNIQEGTLILDTLSGNNDAIVGAVNIGDGSGAANSAVLQSGTTVSPVASNVIADTSAVNLNSDGLWHLNDQTETVGSIAGSGNITLGSGTLTAGGNNASTEFSGIASGTGNLVKSGTGTLTVTGTNAYSGGTTLSAGTLQIGNGGTTGSLTGNVTNNANLTFNRSNSLTQSGVISGTGSVTQAGSGTTTLTANNTYSGGTTISAGTLQIGNGGTTGSLTGNVTNNAALVFDRSDSLTYADVISGSGSVTQNGTGNLTFSNSNTYAGGTTVNAGTLTLASGGSTGAIRGDLTINAGATVEATATDAFGYGGGTKVNNVTVNHGTIINSIAAANGNLGWGVAYTLNNASLTSNGGVSSTSASSNFTLDANSSVNATTGTSTIAGRVNLRSDNGLNVDFTVASGATLNVTAGVTSSAGSTGFTKLGTGTMNLSATNTYAGDTIVSAGTLVLAADDALGSGGSTTVNSGGTLALQGGIKDDNQTLITIAGTGHAGAGAIQNISGANTLIAPITLSADATITADAGSLHLGDDTALDPFSEPISLGSSSLTFDTAGGDISVGATITGSGGIVKTGSGTLLLENGINSFTGTTAINDGTLVLNTYEYDISYPTEYGLEGDLIVGDGIGAANSAVFQQGSLEAPGTSNEYIKDTQSVTVNADGYWNLRGYKETIANLTLNGGTIDAKNSVGAGDRLDVTGVITAANATTSTINGRLGMNNDAAKSIVVDAGATLDINAILSNGGFVKTGSGTLELSGANTFTGVAQIDAGIVRVNNNNGLGATAGKTIVSGTGAQLRLENVTIGAESLDLAGTGISGDGALRSHSGANTWGGSIAMTGNAEIETASGSSLIVTGGITGSGTTLTVESIGTTTFNGVNTFGTLNKTGAGTLTVTNTNTYGTANISAGTFALGASNILSNTMDLNVTGTGNFNVGTHTETIDDLVGSGTLTVAGSGNLTIDKLGGTLSGSNPTGAFTGTLDVDGIMTLNGGTIGTGADGSGSTGSMILTAGNTLTIAGDFNFGGTLQLGTSGTGANLALSGAGTTFDLGALHVIGASSIDFSGVDATTLNLGNLTFDAGATLTVTGWESFSDLWTSTLFPGAVIDTRNATTAKITFSGFSNTDTIWLTYDYGANEITVPEPRSYGALLMAFALAAYATRRPRRIPETP